MTFIIVDIETAPGKVCVEEEFKKIRDFTKDPEERRNLTMADVNAERALDPFLGKVIAIGFHDGERFYYKNSEDEKHLLNWFWEHVAKLKPSKLVTFNGKTFDLPFLYLRSLKYQLKVHTWDKWTGHIDMMRILAGNEGRGTKWHSLKEYANFFSMPAEDTVEGANILYWYLNKGWDKIEHHCRSNVEHTLKLFRIAQESGLV